MNQDDLQSFHRLVVDLQLPLQNLFIVVSEAQTLDDSAKRAMLAAVADLQNRFSSIPSSALDGEVLYEVELAQNVSADIQTIDRAIKRAARSDSYQTPIFKCLDDYNRCIKGGNSKAVCSALATLCVAKQLIPFVK